MERAPRGRDVIPARPVVEKASVAPQRPSKPSKPLPARGTTGDGPSCPESAAHGRMFWLDGAGRYYCPHSEHIGRLATHPDGESPPTKHFFRPDEVTQ